jgi:hypothetical protein
MPSPFPGMDPYLEGSLWPDVHHRLATVFCDLLAPQISPAYVARLNLYTVIDTAPEEDVGIMYPDVEILRRKVEEPERGYSGGTATGFTPATVSIPAVQTVEVRIPLVEIRDRDNNRLITAIEILSPVNKRRPGLEPHREKRRRLHESGVHLLEIDLLRRGERPFTHPYLPHSHYLATLVRSESGTTDVWAFGIRDSLPVLPVPLKKPDKDAFLDLGKALREIYDRGLYHLSIDYRKAPPPPAFEEEDRQWMQELIQAS